MAQQGSSAWVVALLAQKGSSIPVPLRSPQTATAKQVADGAGSRKLGISGIENHAEVFGDDGRLSAVLHLQQGKEGKASEGCSLAVQQVSPIPGAQPFPLLGPHRVPMYRLTPAPC